MPSRYPTSYGGNTVRFHAPVGAIRAWPQLLTNEYRRDNLIWPLAGLVTRNEIDTTAAHVGATSAGASDATFVAPTPLDRIAHAQLMCISSMIELR